MKRKYKRQNEANNGHTYVLKFTEHEMGFLSFMLDSVAKDDDSPYFQQLAGKMAKFIKDGYYREDDFSDDL